MGFFASAPYVVAFFAMLLGGFLMDKVFGRVKPIALIAYVGCIPVLYALGQVDRGNTGMLLRRESRADALCAIVDRRVHSRLTRSVEVIGVTGRTVG